MSAVGRSYRAGRLTVTLTALVLASGLSACSSTSVVPVQNPNTATDQPLPTAGTGSGAPTGGAASTTATADATAVAAASDLARRIGVQPSDLPAPWKGMRVDAVTDRVTDPGPAICGHTLSPDKHGAARHQVTVRDPGGRDTGLTADVIVFDDQVHAQSSLREWRNAVAACRIGSKYRPAAAGAPRVQVDAVSAATNAGLQVQDNTVTSEAVSVLSTGRPRAYTVTVLQVLGAVVEVMRLTSPAPLTPAQVTAATALAAVTGSRLVTS
jgi:hypothetical protein